MNEIFQIAAGGIGDFFHGVQVKFACQYQLRKPDLIQKHGFFNGADVGLCAGMQLHGRQIDFKQAHVLHDQCIYACVVDDIFSGERDRIIPVRIPRKPSFS